MEPSPLLAHLAITATATPIHGGWASWTFDLDGTHILRVARTPETVAAHRREERLLPELAAHVGFAVPVPTEVGEYDGHTYMVYPKLPGHALGPDDRLDEVTAVLRELHDFPVDRAEKLLGCRADGWHDDYVESWKWVSGVVLPVLDPALRKEVAARYTAALSTLEGFEPVLVHRDLGTEHILCDDAGSPTALIDFETATVGDPAIDFVGLWAIFGEDTTTRLIEDYGRPISLTRLNFYLWMGAVHAIRYGIEEGDDKIIADAIAGLRSRLEAAA